MSDAVAKLFPVLDAMTPAERAVVREYLDALAAEPDMTQDEWEAAWAEEVERRVAAVERGEMELIPAEEVFRRLDEKYGT